MMTDSLFIIMCSWAVLFIWPVWSSLLWLS